MIYVLEPRETQFFGFEESETRSFEMHFMDMVYTEEPIKDFSFCHGLRTDNARIKLAEEQIEELEKFKGPYKKVRESLLACGLSLLLSRHSHGNEEGYSRCKKLTMDLHSLVNSVRLVVFSRPELFVGIDTNDRLKLSQFNHRFSMMKKRIAESIDNRKPIRHTSIGMMKAISGARISLHEGRWIMI